jgi:hypothetical protein
MDFEGFLVYYLTTVLLETPVLLVGLSRRHPLLRRLFAGVWLNACSYPIVYIVLPAAFELAGLSIRPASEGGQRPLFLLVAEVFAPVAECALFYAAFWSGGSQAAREVPPSGGRFALWQDMAVIVLANLVSFVPLELIRVWYNWTPDEWFFGLVRRWNGSP